MNATELKQLAIEAGFELAGIADPRLPMEGFQHLQRWLENGMEAGMTYMNQGLRESPLQLLPTAKSALVVGKFVSQPNPVVKGQPLIARYALGRDYHNVLRKRLRSIARKLPEGTDWRVSVDSAPILERELAKRAGLGWFGKNTMLINSARGSYFLIATLLTSLDLEYDQPSHGGCGTCRACIDACPTGAIVDLNGRPTVDARQCISYWTIEHRGDIPEAISRKMGNWTFGCDICQEICPFNHVRESQPLRAKTINDQAFLPKAHPTLVEFLEMDETRWDEVSMGSPIRRAGLSGIKRNAAISLKNGN